MKSLCGGSTYDVSKDGWLHDCLKDIYSKKSCAVVVSGPAAMEIAERMQGISAEIGKTVPGALEAAQKLVKVLPGLPSLPSLPIDPVSVVGSLAGLGAEGGMVTTVMIAAVAGHMRGAYVAVVEIIPPSLTDAAQYELHIEFIFLVTAT